MAMQSINLAEIKSNPFRSEDFEFNQDKVDSLKQSIKETSFWENILARKNDDGEVELAYGHHRIEALRQLAKEDEAMEAKYSVVKINVRPSISNETMLQIFAQENRDDWKDVPDNITRTLIATKKHLDDILAVSLTVEDFKKRTGCGDKIKMNQSQFEKALDGTGVGSSTIAQFLGFTWSQPAISQALKIIDKGKDNKEFQNLMSMVPGITVASRLTDLLTDPDSKSGSLVDEKEVAKVKRLVGKGDLSRSEVEDAIKLKEEGEVSSPFEALKQAQENRKADKKAKKEAAKQPPAPKYEVAVQRMKSLRSLIRSTAAKYTDEDIKVLKETGIAVIKEIGADLTNIEKLRADALAEIEAKAKAKEEEKAKKKAEKEAAKAEKAAQEMADSED